MQCTLWHVSTNHCVEKKGYLGSAEMNLQKYITHRELFSFVYNAKIQFEIHWAKYMIDSNCHWSLSRCNSIFQHLGILHGKAAITKKSPSLQTSLSVIPIRHLGSAWQKFAKATRSFELRVAEEIQGAGIFEQSQPKFFRINAYWNTPIRKLYLLVSGW